MSEKIVPPLFDAIYNDDGIAIHNSFFDLAPYMSHVMVLLSLETIKTPNKPMPYYAKQIGIRTSAAWNTYKAIKELIETLEA